MKPSRREHLTARRERARDAMAAEWCDTDDSERRYIAASAEFDDADDQIRRLTTARSRAANHTQDGMANSARHAEMFN